MVVENIPGVWRFSVLRPHLRRLLLCQQGKKKFLLGSHFLFLLQRFSGQGSPVTESQAGTSASDVLTASPWGGTDGTDVCVCVCLSWTS